MILELQTLPGTSYNVGCNGVIDFYPPLVGMQMTICMKEEFQLL